MNGLIPQQNTPPCSQGSDMGTGHLQQELSPEAYAELMEMTSLKRPEPLTLVGKERGSNYHD